MSKYYIIALLVMSSASFGDAVVWNYDLTYLPDGWSADSYWNFSSFGANLSLYASGPYEYVTGNLYTDCIMIPDNCDSIILYVEQDLEVWWWGEGFARVRVRYRNNDMVWHYLWSGGPIETDPLVLSVPPYSGQGLCFWFFGSASGGSLNNEGGGSVSWRLWDLTLTFYGENLELEATTWASIKRCF